MVRTVESHLLPLRSCEFAVLHLYAVHYFFFNDTATTEIYTLSLHDALPISRSHPAAPSADSRSASAALRSGSAAAAATPDPRSEEHTSELQSHSDLVCRLLLEKKKKKDENVINTSLSKPIPIYNIHTA